MVDLKVGRERMGWDEMVRKMGEGCSWITPPQRSWALWLEGPYTALEGLVATEESVHPGINLVSELVVLLSAATWPLPR
jgi:hypothetical protein